MMSGLTCSCFYLWRSWLLPRQGTGLNFYGSAKHLGFTSKPLQQDQLHVTTEGGDPLHHLAGQRGLCPCPGCLHPSPRCFHHCPGGQCPHCSLVQCCSGCSLIFLDPSLSVSSQNSGESVTGAGDGERGGRRGPIRRWQGSATMDHITHSE